MLHSLYHDVDKDIKEFQDKFQEMGSNLLTRTTLNSNFILHSMKDILRNIGARRQILKQKLLTVFSRNGY